MKDIFQRYKYYFMVLLFIMMAFVSIINYNDIKVIIKDKYQKQQKLIEQNILMTINHVNDAYVIAEEQLNQEMKKYSLKMIEKYEENQDVLNWDL